MKVAFEITPSPIKNWAIAHDFEATEFFDTAEEALRHLGDRGAVVTDVYNEGEGHLALEFKLAGGTKLTGVMMAEF